MRKILEFFFPEIKRRRLYDEERERENKEWRERIQAAGGQHFYDILPAGVPFGLYRAKTKQGKWYTVGVNPNGMCWVGDALEVGKVDNSPRSMEDFIEWFGPDEVMSKEQIEKHHGK